MSGEQQEPTMMWCYECLEPRPAETLRPVTVAGKAWYVCDACDADQEVKVGQGSTVRAVLYTVALVAALALATLVVALAIDGG